MPDRRVYVVDDDAQFRGALQFLFMTHQMTSQAFADGRTFVEKIEDLDPGCVLLDIRMPHMDGMTALERMQPFLDRFAVIVMTGHGDVHTAVKAMKMGAIDFVEKPFDEEMLVGMVQNAQQRVKIVQAESESRRAAEEKVSKLTPREKEVLLHLMSGSSNKTAAQKMGVSPRTVEMHRSNMTDRLGANKLSEAIRVAFLAGLMPEEDESSG